MPDRADPAPLLPSWEFWPARLVATEAAAAHPGTRPGPPEDHQKLGRCRPPFPAPEKYASQSSPIRFAHARDTITAWDNIGRPRPCHGTRLADNLAAPLFQKWTKVNQEKARLACRADAAACVPLRHQLRQHLPLSSEGHHELGRTWRDKVPAILRCLAAPGRQQAGWWPSPRPGRSRQQLAQEKCARSAGREYPTVLACSPPKPFAFCTA